MAPISDPALALIRVPNQPVTSGSSRVPTSGLVLALISASSQLLTSLIVGPTSARISVLARGSVQVRMGTTAPISSALAVGPIGQLIPANAPIPGDRSSSAPSR